MEFSITDDASLLKLNDDIRVKVELCMMMHRLFVLNCWSFLKINFNSIICLFKTLKLIKYNYNFFYQSNNYIS